MKRVALVACAVALAPPAGAGAEPTWGPASWLAQPTDAAQDICCGGSLAINAQGDVVVGWQLSIGSTPIAMATWRRAGTVDWSGPVRLAEGASMPQVAVDPAGNALALFDKGIVQAAYHTAGMPAWDAPITIGGQSFARGVAFDGVGNATAVWTDWRYPSTVAQTATLAASETWQQPPIDISAPTGTAGGSVSLALDPSGDAVAAWRYVTPDGSRYIEAAGRPGGTGAWESPVRLTTPASAAYSFTNPFVAIDDSGGATVVWGYDRGSVHAAYRPRGGGWTPDQEVARVGDPRGVAVQPGGAALVLFTVGDRSSVLAASHTSAAAPWSAPVPLSDPARETFGAALASDARGNAIATWVEAADSWGAPRTLRAALRPAASGRWEPAVDVAKGAAGGYSTDVAIDGSGRALALWNPYVTAYRQGLQVAELTGGGPVLSRLDVQSTGGTGVRTPFSVTPVPWAAPLVGETQWDFGDGTTATGNDVRHVYTREGTYEVRVAALASDGASSETRTITIGKATLVNTERPAIRGVARLGRTVRCDPGTWNGTEPIVYAYSWLRNGSPIARGQRYRIRTADSRALLACRVKATNGPKTAVAMSRPVRVRWRLAKYRIRV